MNDEALIPTDELKHVIEGGAKKVELILGNALKDQVQGMEISMVSGGESARGVPRRAVQDLINQGDIVLNPPGDFVNKTLDRLGLKRPEKIDASI